MELVAEGIGMDKRISRHFLNAGLGYGGSCFPKDVKAFINISRTLGIPFTLLEEVEHINDTQHIHFLDRIRDRLWVLKDKKIAVWGLAFKQNTDDVRESIALKLCEKLCGEGAIVTATDPKAMHTAAPILNPMGSNWWKTCTNAPGMRKFWSSPRNGANMRMRICRNSPESCATASSLTEETSSPRQTSGP